MMLMIVHPRWWLVRRAVLHERGGGSRGRTALASLSSSCSSPGHVPQQASGHDHASAPTLNDHLPAAPPCTGGQRPRVREMRRGQGGRTEKDERRWQWPPGEEPRWPHRCFLWLRFFFLPAMHACSVGSFPRLPQVRMTQRSDVSVGARH